MMIDQEIEEIAREARRRLGWIPYAEQEKIDFCTCEYSDPVVCYETRPDGYYQVVNERGTVRETLVARDREGMTAYFVEQAIWDYALRYEVRHRRRFESNLRQMDEIMERCYQYIEPGRRFVREQYDDEIHIYLDLLDEYVKIAREYRENQPLKYQKVKADIDFIADKQYADTPNGGMTHVPEAMSAVRDRVKRLGQADRKLLKAFGRFEQYYKLLNQGDDKQGTEGGKR